MRFTIYALIICIYMGFMGCSTTKVKHWPEYKGVDPEVQPYVVDYFRLAKERNIEFKRKVTIGLTKIKDPGVVGICTDALIFREIDFDMVFWQFSSPLTKKILAFHELSHCYCRRDHDYGMGLGYDKKSWHSKTKFETAKPFITLKVDGFFDDLCPLSLMYPSILNDWCAKAHFDHYINEMFERCRAY